MDRAQFDFITKKYGHVASWAVWKNAGESPKSNIDDLSVLDPDKNTKLLEILNPNVIMVGLHLSGNPDENFDATKFPRYINFHSPNPHGNDYKLRFAFKDTPYYGAYMTDVIKNCPNSNSTEIQKKIKNNPDLLKENIKFFRAELKDLGCSMPLILAFGVKAYTFLKKNLDKSEYSHLIQIMHFSNYISKENYRTKVLEQIKAGKK